MKTKYSKAFKIEAVKKAISRSSDTSLRTIASNLDVKMRTLQEWVKAMKNKELRNSSDGEGSSKKAPFNWSATERLQAIIDTAQMSLEALSEYCRKKGIFPHHIEQWKSEFIKSKSNSETKSDLKELRQEIKRLNSELNRKEKALAEAAALLILKKKVQEFWNNSEEV